MPHHFLNDFQGDPRINSLGTPRMSLGSLVKADVDVLLFRVTRRQALFTVFSFKGSPL